MRDDQFKNIHELESTGGTTKGVIRTKATKVLTHLPNVTLIDTDDQVDQNKWSKSKTVNLATAVRTGEIISVRITTKETGSGTLLRNPIDLVIFKEDPSYATSNVDHYENSTDEGDDGLGHISVLDGDWLAGSDGTDEFAEATAVTAFPFITDSSGNLYVAVVNRGATAYNSDPGDEEVVKASFLVEWRD